MGILSTITKPATEEHGGPARVPPPTPPAFTCQWCAGLDRWLDPYGRWHCPVCDPPPHPSMVRQTVQSSPQSTPRASSGLDTVAPITPADWTADDWQAVPDPLRPGKTILYNRRLVFFDGRRFISRAFGWEIGPPLGMTWQQWEQRNHAPKANGSENTSCRRGIHVRKGFGKS